MLKTGNRLIWIGVVMMAAAMPLAASKYVVAPPAGSDANGGTGWGDAWATISNAVRQSAADETVLVSNGTYNITAQITIRSNLTIRGFSGRPADTIVNAGGLAITNCFYMTNAAILVESLTVTNSAAKGFYLDGTGTVRNCVISGHKSTSTDGSGCGVYCNRGGVVENCIISDNESQYASGVVLYSSASSGSGGGTVRNCLIINNTRTQGDGGGVYISRTPCLVENCIITRNTAVRKGGGVYGAISGGSVKNSIIFGNISPVGEQEYGGTITITYSCASPLPAGAGNTNANPQFVDAANMNFHLLPCSPCRNTGLISAWMTDATDLDGNPRTNIFGVDMSCYEYQVGALDCGFYASPLSAFPPGTIVFTAAAAGTNTANVYYHWDFTNSGAFNMSGIDLTTVTNVYAAAGRYSVALMVTNDIGEMRIYARTNYITIGPATTYVAKVGNIPAFPYDTLSTAASNVQDAMDAAVDGSLVLVGDGHYVLTNTLCISNAVTLRSAGGKTAAILDGNGATNCLYMDNTNAVVAGFTISNGYLAAAGRTPGVHFYRGGTVSNCNIIGNKVQGSAANTYGGGFFIEGPGGVLSHCVVASNSSKYYGGGSVYYGGVVRNCLVKTNTALTTGSSTSGGIGALGGGTIESCTIVGNQGAGGGGGVYGSAGCLYNCIVWSNYVGSVLTNCNGAFTNANNCTTPTFGENCISNYPLFVDSEYHIRDNSPCYNQGTNRSWMPGAVDLDGNPRIFRGRADIGAYEAIFQGMFFYMH